MSDEEKDTAASPEVAPAAPKAPEVKPQDKPVEIKKHDYVLVQHLQRDKETRGTRAARGGSRRQGVLLDDGTRIRQKAYRYSEIAISTLASNHQSILEHLRDGRLAIFSAEEEELSYDEVLALLKGKGAVEKIEEKPLKEAVKEMVAGVRDEDVIPKSTDITKPDVELSATLAAADMAEESKKLSKKKEASGELTEEELLKKPRAELNKIAKDYGVKHPEKLDSKQAVVDAIFAAAEKE